MPAFYAHAYFGTQVLSLLPAPLKEICQQHANAFLLGTQGPDVLFYHKPFKANDTRNKGSQMHLDSAKAFFIRAREKALENGGNDEILAYVSGFICHFALDNACHPHVFVLEDTGIQHGRIESEFDKFIKRKEGKRVHKNAAAPLRATKALSNAVAAVLEVEASEAKRSIQTMRFINGLLSSPSKTFHRFAQSLVKNGKISAKYGSLFLFFEDEPSCTTLSPDLYEQLEQAIAPTAKRVAQFFEAQPETDFFDGFDKDYKGESLL